ncbi:hypothetical protein GEMRC1_000677 [Eukaryota sp. GEM-RC1]
MQLKGDGFIRNSLSVIENDHVREDLKNQAQNNVGRLYVEPPVAVDPERIDLAYVLGLDYIFDLELDIASPQNIAVDPTVADGSDSDVDPPVKDISDIDLDINSPIPRHSLLHRLFCCCGV